MEITWYGLSCFRLMERGRPSIVTDPFKAVDNGKQLRADIVTISHIVPGHADMEVVKGNDYMLSRPGEYEIGGIFFKSIATHNREQPDLSRKNNAFNIYIDDLTVCHLGDLDHVPTRKNVEELGPIDVLLIPVGGGMALNSSQATEVISMIEPGIVIPMHYAHPGNPYDLDPLDKFLKEMGISEYDKLDSLKISTKASLEETKVVILNIQE